MMSGYNFYLLISYISSCSVGIPFIFGIINKEKLTNSNISLLFMFVASVITEIVSVILHKNNIQNLFVFRIYTVVQFLLLSIFYVQSISSEKFKFFIKPAFTIFLIVELIDCLKSGFYSMDDAPLSVASIFLMIYSLFTFYYILQNTIYLNILNESVFWVNSAVLMYFSGCLFLFIFNSYVLNKSHKLHYELWGINSILNITFNVLMAIGFWKTRHRQIS